MNTTWTMPMGIGQRDTAGYAKLKSYDIYNIVATWDLTIFTQKITRTETFGVIERTTKATLSTKFQHKN